MYSGGKVFRSWAPFLLLSVFVAAWGINNVQTAMNQIFLVKLPIEGLDKMVIDDVGKVKDRGLYVQRSERRRYGHSSGLVLLYPGDGRLHPHRPECRRQYPEATLNGRF